MNFRLSLLALCAIAAAPHHGVRNITHGVKTPVGFFHGVKTPIWNCKALLRGRSVACAGGITGPPQDPEQTASPERWTARFAGSGLYLNFDDIPALKGGLVQVFSADGARGYYGSGSQPPVTTVETLSDGGRAYLSTFRYSEGGHTFVAHQRIDLHPQRNTVVFTIQARWRGPDAASLEWNPVRLWAYPLLGAAYVAEAGGREIARGRIGLRVPGAVYPANRLAPPWQRLRLTNASYGALEFTGVSGNDGPVLLDGRADPYLQDDKLFWLGTLGTPLPPNQEVTRSLTLHLIPRSESATPERNKTAAPEMVSADRISIPDALRPEAPLLDRQGHLVLIPQPKRVAFSPARFALAGDLAVSLHLPDDSTGRSVTLALDRFLAELQNSAGIRPRKQKTTWNGKGLFVAVAGSIAPDVSRHALPRPPSSAESYTLQVSGQSVVLIGRDAAGTFYGLQTLRQLLTPQPSETYAFVGADIQDWPSLRFRGAHLFVGHQALPFHKKLIDRIFSRYKLNALALECEYTRWKSHPEILVDYAMSPDDLRADVDDARLHFMEPIPLINSLGHSEWMFQNHQHLDLAEDIHAPHAYDASNPATYRFLFDIYGEALDIFHPRYFHIGHDEVKIPGSSEFGAYPARPANIRKGVTRLFIDDTRRLCAWLTGHGVRPMLWGDMLLHRSEGEPVHGVSALSAANAPDLAAAKQRRAGIPHDAILADWRYEAGSEQRNGLETLQKAGFSTLGCSWYQPENIRGWAQQAIQHHALGLLQTTWAGYDSNEALLESDFAQFSAYLLAAEYTWSGNTLHPQGTAASTPLPYDANAVFRRAYSDAPLLAAPRAGWFLDLRHAANIQLTLEDAEGLPWHAFSGVASAPNSVSSASKAADLPGLAGVGLRLVGSLPAGLMLNGRINPTTLPTASGENRMVRYPAAVVLPVHARAAGLAFLQATGYGVATGERVGTYTIFYTDGQRLDIPLRYGMETRALDDNALTAYTTTPVPWQVARVPLTMRLFRWTNPRAEVGIDHLEFRADSAEAAPILFAVTAF